jgi:hypothetical protein
MLVIDQLNYEKVHGKNEILMLFGRKPKIKLKWVLDKHSFFFSLNV